MMVKNTTVWLDNTGKQHLPAPSTIFASVFPVHVPEK